MDYKPYIFLIGSYLFAFFLNLMPSIKYPDLNMNVWNLVVTLVFMFLLIMYSKQGKKKLKIFSLVGVISAVLVFLITAFEQVMFEHAFLDAIASLQYPLYLLFITPLFGGNDLFDVSYGLYSLLMSLFYGIVFGLTLYFRRDDSRSF
ncbi:hypothetical protein [Aquibacillus kalidii]|uniref:hypothetical protein n=1 Tax=Aquibacillus kalidii TaxID=2762597 RepID=UPI0016446727|nr:hypothetical protein [Aquibacillus kalidii]